MRDRVIRFEVKLNYKENNKLCQDAKKANLTKSEYVRKLINESVIKEKPDDKFYDVMIQLTKIGNNLNQIAHKANYLNNIDADAYEKEATNWRAFMKSVKQEFL